MPRKRRPWSRSSACSWVPRCWHRRPPFSADDDCQGDREGDREGDRLLPTSALAGAADRRSEEVAVFYFYPTSYVAQAATRSSARSTTPA